jgi:hypothetical protein
MVAEVSMADKRYLVSCKTPEMSTFPVVAASCEVHGEHLVLLNSKGRLADVFLLETLESWSVNHMSEWPPERFSESVEWGDSEQVEFADGQSVRLRRQ